MQKKTITRWTITFFLGAVFATTVLHGQTENYYAPFHWRTKDSTQMTVSKLGHYVSAGIGGGGVKGQGGLSEVVSYSLAYKSHILSFTRFHAGTFDFGGGDNLPFFWSRYYGCLIGESIRMKNFFLSLSAGVANSYVDVKYKNPHPTSSPSSEFLGYYTEGISYPIELKLFILARNGVGFGLHVSKNIVSPAEYSPFFWGISIVFGRWNKARVTNK